MQKKIITWRQSIAYYYIIFLFTVGVLYIEDRYANLSQAKMHICLAGVAIFGLLLLLGNGKELWRKKKPLGMLDLALLAFAVSNIISTIASPYGVRTIWGLSEWKMGSLFVVSLVAMYFLVSRGFVYRHNVWLLPMGVLCLQSIWILLQFMGFDPFYLHEGMLSNKLHYIGTIGNVNWYVGYLGILLAVCIHFSLSATERLSQIIYGVFFCFAYVSVLLCHSDSIYLALGITAVLESFYLLKHPEKISIFLQQGIYLFVAGLTVQMLPNQYTQVIDGVSGFLLSKYLYIFIGLVCGLCIGALSRWPIKCVPSMAVWAYILVLIGVMGGIGYFLMTHYSASFGTNRGLIWEKTIAYYQQFESIEKMVGKGPDSVVEWMAGEVIDGKYISGVHCELLQNLVCLGILGALSYVSIYIATIITFVKKKEKPEQSFSLFFAIMAYGMQALVNNAQALNIAMLFAILAVFQNTMREEENEF